LISRISFLFSFYRAPKLPILPLTNRFWIESVLDRTAAPPPLLPEQSATGRSAGAGALLALFLAKLQCLRLPTATMTSLGWPSSPSCPADVTRPSELYGVGVLVQHVLEPEAPEGEPPDWSPTT